MELFIPLYSLSKLSTFLVVKDDLSLKKIVILVHM